MKKKNLLLYLGGILGLSESLKNKDDSGMSRHIRDPETIQMLRKGISQSDTIACKDFRLCGVEIFESVYLSDDPLEVKEQNLQYLEELYKKYPPDDPNMDELMRLFREKVTDLKRTAERGPWEPKDGT